jgi:glycosyltransferase involved in cell wall biosynthesis
VIRNGSSRLIPDRQDPAVRAVRDDLCGDGTQLVGSVAVLRAQKRLDVLLDAFATVEHDDPGVRLVVVGDGPELPRLRRRASMLGLRGVRFLGHRDDIGTLLAAFDVFAMSSESEGTPRALIEAMRAGLGVVATRVGGIPELAPDGQFALLVPARDPERLAAGISRLLRERGVRDRLGAAAKERAEELFSSERMLEDWSALFCELALHGRGRRR